MNTQEANQKVFDDALEHIRQQGCAAHENAHCSYKTSDGRGCAFAPQIAEYVPEMENRNVFGLRDQSNGLVRNLTEAGQFCNIDVAGAIQECHDRWAADMYTDDFVSLFEKSMREVAEKYNLEYKEAV